MGKFILPEAGRVYRRILELGSFDAGYCLMEDYPSGALPALTPPREAESVLMTAWAIPGPEAEEDLSSPEDPHGLIAPFAQANYYALAQGRLKVLAQEIRRESGFPKDSFRVFVNSRFPEKPLAFLAGLGAQGKNSLLLNSRRGSRLILAGVFLPFRFPKAAGEGFPPRSDGAASPCSGCRLCVEACPTGALPGDGTLDRSRCLQAMATSEMPQEYRRAFKTRLYGCQICQNVCPANKDLSPGPVLDKASRGYLGPSVSLRSWLRAGGKVKEPLAGSVLNRNWIEPFHLLRNSLIAGGNHPWGRSLRPEIEAYLDGGDPRLAEAAAWALASLSG